MKIILLSDFFPVKQEHLLLNALFEEGLEYFHLRKRSFSEAQMRRYLDQISPKNYNKIIIHSHFHLSDQYGLKGLHFKKEFTVADFALDQGVSLDWVRQKYNHISHSSHSILDIKRAIFSYNYMFLSPVFDSISNKGYNSKIKIKTIRKFFNEEPMHSQVIALSGMTTEKIKHVQEVGFNGFGLLGYIWIPYKEDGNLLRAVNRFKLVQSEVKKLTTSSISSW